MVKNIYLFCPDFPHPSGGTKRVYAVTNILRRHGFNAAVMHQHSNFKLQWTSIDVPIVYQEETATLTHEDLLVIPEGCTLIMQWAQHMPCKKIVFAMSIEYIVQALPLNETWKSYGIEMAITTTDGIADFIQYLFKIPTFTVGFSVDNDLFQYTPQVKQKLIVFMGRPESNKREAFTIARILHEINPAFRDYKLLPLENLPIEQYAVAMRCAEYYLTFLPRWSANISCFEAMACGCVVGGYTGLGANCVVKNGYNCVLAAHGNYCEAAQLLNTVACSEDLKKSLIAHALETKHTKEDEEENIRTIFSELVQENNR